MNFTELAKSYYNLFNSFGITGYLEGSVPTGASFPYLTYNLSNVSNFEENLIQVKLYSKSSSLVEISSIIDRIENYIGEGVKFDFDNNIIWLYKGSPFAQLVNDEDSSIKSALINIVSRH